MTTRLGIISQCACFFPIESSKLLTHLLRYWLPTFLHHDYILLQIVRQEAVNILVPMSPRPDADIVRIFMVFKGLSGGEAPRFWLSQIRDEEEGVEIWRNALGIPYGEEALTGKPRIVEANGYGLSREPGWNDI